MPIIGNMHALIAGLVVSKSGPTGPSPATATQAKKPIIHKPEKSPSATEGKG